MCHMKKIRIRGQERVSSVYFLVRHLAAAGLLLSCLFIPVEVRGVDIQG